MRYMQREASAWPLTEAGPKSFISDRRRMCAWNIDFSLKRLPTYAEGFCRWKFRV